MNAPPAMTCESCRDLLIELVCDELSPERAAEVRAHALRYERCGPELEKLSATLRISHALPLLSPSPEVEQRVMQAARDAIARRARGPAREASVPTPGGFTAWFARLGSFAMSPQVAMASVLLLVVGIGLYALPLGHDPEPTALRAADDEAAGDEHSAAAPAASATAVPSAEEAARQAEPVPAERLQGALSRRKAEAYDPGESAKDTLREEKALDGLRGAAKSAPQAFPEGKVASGPKPTAATAPPKVLQKPATERDLGGLGAASGGAAQPLAEPAFDKRKPSKAAPAASEAPAPAAAGSKGGALADDSASNFAPPPPPAAAPAAPADRSLEAEAVASEGSVSRSKKESAGAKADGAPSALAKGIMAIQHGEHAAGQALLLPLLTSGSPSERDQARLWLARSFRERGDCARALEYYRPLVQAVTAPRAVLVEAADCNERTGNAAVAAKLRSRAALPAKE